MLFLTGLLAVSTTYYIYRYHGNEFLKKCQELSLDALTYARYYYHQYYPPQLGQVRPLQVYLVGRDFIRLLSPGEWLNLPTRFPCEYLHVIYEFEGQVYRIVLNYQQDLSFLKQIEKIQGKPRTSVEDWTTTLTIPSDELFVLLQQYAGPLGDFYNYLHHVQPSSGLLTLDLKKHLLGDNDQLQIEDILGNEWHFSLPMSLVPKQTDQTKSSSQLADKLKSD